MSNLREAAQQALEEMSCCNYNSAAERIRHALAQPDDKAQPVGWIDEYGNFERRFYPWMEEEGGWKPVYVAPQPPAEQSAAEKALRAAHEQHQHYRETMKPVERGAELSDEQIVAISRQTVFAGCGVYEYVEFARAVIAADRVKRNK